MFAGRQLYESQERDGVVHLARASCPTAPASVIGPYRVLKLLLGVEEPWERRRNVLFRLHEHDRLASSPAEEGRETRAKVLADHFHVDL